MMIVLKMFKLQILGGIGNDGIFGYLCSRYGQCDIRLIYYALGIRIVCRDLGNFILVSQFSARSPD